MSEDQDLIATITENIHQIIEDARLEQATNSGNASLELQDFHKAAANGDANLPARIKSAFAHTKNCGYVRGLLESALRLTATLHKWRIDHPEN